MWNSGLKMLGSFCLSVFQNFSAVSLLRTALPCFFALALFPVRCHAQKKVDQIVRPATGEELSFSLDGAKVPYPCGYFDKNAGMFIYNKALADFLVSKRFPVKELERELAEGIQDSTQLQEIRKKITIEGNDYLAIIIRDYVDKDLWTFFISDGSAFREHDGIALMLILVDNYDEVLRSAATKDHPSVIAEIDNVIYQWCVENEIYVKKTNEDKYVGLISNCRLTVCQADHFSILERIHSINRGNTAMPTLSIGISMGDQSAPQIGANTESALEIALSRGGDQVVIWEHGSYRYYGAKLNLNRSRSRVKARMTAKQINNAIQSANEVIIMGHKAPDLDSLGAAVAIAVVARLHHKRARIISAEDDPWIKRITGRLIPAEVIQKLFISPDDAVHWMDPMTLLVVVDTNRPELVIVPELLEKASKLIVVDHHRRVSETIERAEIMYVDPYASSTTELVVEFFRYQNGAIVLDEWEATLMLAGIALDTKSFTVFTGAETFDIAAYLRREGADPLLVRDMMRDDLSTFILRAEIMHNIEIHRNNIALGICRETIVNAAELASQAADQMLNIRSVEASFVLCKYPEGIWVSARSLGSINVQSILEKLGGGGHMMGAGAQLSDPDIDKAKAKLVEAIDTYLDGRG